MSASGFQKVAVRFTAPFPEEYEAADGSRPRPIGRTASRPSSIENVGKLNDLLFTYLDYAAIGERL